MNLKVDTVKYYTDQGMNLLDVAEKLNVKFSILRRFMKVNNIVKKEVVIEKIPKMSVSTVHDTRTVSIEDIMKGLGK